jgi:hypothetical protein
MLRQSYGKLRRCYVMLSECNVCGMSVRAKMFKISAAIRSSGPAKWPGPKKDCYTMQTKRVQTPREVARHLQCNACNTNATICNSLQKYRISAAIRSLEPANWPGSQGLPCGVQKADAMHLRMQQATPSCGFGKQAPPVMRNADAYATYAQQGVQRSTTRNETLQDDAMC